LKGAIALSQPLAIYASIPATVPPTAGPNWEGVQPVTVADPFRFWPDLDWRGDGIMPSSPVTEVPEYLWIVSVADPDDTVSVNFIRRWEINNPGTQFDTRGLPAGVYDITISFAADDQYSMQLLVNATPLIPTGSNTFTPPDFPWRNVKTYQYSNTVLTAGSVLRLSTLVTNLAQPVGTPPQDNPAMFAWTMQVFSNL
jgi:hypothetical protein